MQRKTQPTLVSTQKRGRDAHPASQSILPAEFTMVGQNGVTMCVRTRYVFGGSFRLIFEIGGSSVSIDTERTADIKIMIRDLTSENPTYNRYNLVFGGSSLGLQSIQRGEERLLAIMGVTTSIFLDEAGVNRFVGELDRLIREIGEFAQKRGKRTTGRPVLTVIASES